MCFKAHKKPVSESLLSIRLTPTNTHSLLSLPACCMSIQGGVLYREKEMNEVLCSSFLTSRGSSSSSRLLRVWAPGPPKKTDTKKGGISLLLSSLHSQSLRELAPAGTSRPSPRLLSPIVTWTIPVENEKPLHFFLAVTQLDSAMTPWLWDFSSELKRLSAGPVL